MSRGRHERRSRIDRVLAVAWWMIFTDGTAPVVLLMFAAGSALLLGTDMITLIITSAFGPDYHQPQPFQMEVTSCISTIRGVRCR